MVGILIVAGIAILAYYLGKRDGRVQAHSELSNRKTIVETSTESKKQVQTQISVNATHVQLSSNSNRNEPSRIVSGIYYYAKQASFQSYRGALTEIANSIVEQRDPNLNIYMLHESKSPLNIPNQHLIDKADFIPAKKIISGLRYYASTAEKSYIKFFLLELANSIEQRRDPLFRPITEPNDSDYVARSSSMVTEQVPQAKTLQQAVIPAVATPQIAAVPREKVNPFELLRNINILLFTGAFLVILTVIIFVISSFAALSGWQKVIVVAIFGLIFYLSGLVLFIRYKKLKPAGVAFTIIGVITIPFALIAFRSYVATDISLSSLWLLLSLSMVAISFLTGFVTKWKSMKFIGLTSLAISALSSVILLPIGIPIGFFTFYILAILYEFGSRYIKSLKDPLHILSLLIFITTTFANIFGLFYFEVYQVGISLLLGVIYLLTWWFVHPGQNEMQKEANIFTAVFLSWLSVGTFIFEFNDNFLMTSQLLFGLSVFISSSSMFSKFAREKSKFIFSSLYLSGVATGVISTVAQLSDSRSLAISLIVLCALYLVHSVIRQSQVLIYSSLSIFLLFLVDSVYAANVVPPKTNLTVFFTVCLLLTAIVLAVARLTINVRSPSEFRIKVQRALLVCAWAYLIISYITSMFSQSASIFFVASSVLSLALLWRVVRHKQSPLLVISAITMTLAWMIFGSFGPSWIRQININYILLSLGFLRLLSGRLYHQKPAQLYAAVIGIGTLLLNYLVSHIFYTLSSNGWIPIWSLLALVAGLFYASWQYRDLWFFYGFGMAFSYPALLIFLNKITISPLTFEQSTLSVVALSIFFTVIGVIQNAMFASRIGLISRYGSMIPLLIMLIFPNNFAVIFGIIILALQLFLESYLSVFKARLNIRLLAIGFLIFALSRIFWQFDVRELQAYVALWVIYSFGVAVVMEQKQRKSSSVVWQIIGLLILLPILLVQSFMYQFDWHAWLLLSEVAGLIVAGKVIPNRTVGWGRGYALIGCSVIGIYMLSQSFSTSWSLPITAIFTTLALFMTGWLYIMKHTFFSVGMALGYFTAISVVSKLLDHSITLNQFTIIVMMTSLFYSAIGWLASFIGKNPVSRIFRLGAIIPLSFFVFFPVSWAIIAATISLSIMIFLEGLSGGYQNKLDIKLLAIAGMFYSLTRTFIQLDITEFQVYAVSWSVYSLIVVITMERVKRLQASNLWQAIGLVVLTVPLFYQTLINPLDWHVLMLFVESVGLVMLGASLRRDIFWRWGISVLVLQSLYQFGGAIFAIPRILLGFIVGISLLGAGIYFLWRRNDDEPGDNGSTLAS
jgi:hypothetical protein